MTEAVGIETEPFVRLEPVDRAEVTIVVDNFVDVLMAGSDDVARYLATDFGDRDQLVAEHGFSALLTVELGGRRSSVLYDGGLTPPPLPATSTSSKCRSESCVLSSSRTDMQTITAGWKRSSSGTAAGGCRS